MPKFDAGGHNIIIIFGDIAGFRVWTRRVGHSSKAFRHLMQPCIKVWLELKAKGYYLKLLGDGFMAVKEMGNGHNCELAFNVIKDAWIVADKTKRIIEASPYPRPLGFRSRVSSGESAIVKIKDETDYLGYMVNTTKDFLQIHPEIPCIIHESVKELLKNEHSDHLDFKKVKVSGKYKGIEKEDLDALWMINLKDGPDGH